MKSQLIILFLFIISLKVYSETSNLTLPDNYDKEAGKLRCEAYGDYYFNNKKYSEAIPYYDTLLLLDNNNGFNYQSRGVCYLLKEKYDLAMPDFTKSLELNPEDSTGVVKSVKRATLVKAPDGDYVSKNLIFAQYKNFHSYAYRAQCKAKKNDFKSALSD